VEEKISSDILNHIQELLAKVPENVIKERLPNYNSQSMVFHKGAGCAYCDQTGYHSRTVIAEVLEINDKVRDMILQNESFSEEKVKATQPFITMEQDGIIKALQGLTTVEEVMRVIQSD